MKGLIILLVATFFAATFAQTLNKEQIEKLKAHYLKCTKETGVDVQLIMQGREGKFSEDDKLAHYYFCMFKEIGVINDNAEIQTDVAIAKKPEGVSKEDIEKLIALCEKEKGADKFKTAQKLYECYYKANPKHGSIAAAALGQ